MDTYTLVMLPIYATNVNVEHGYRQSTGEDLGIKNHITLFSDVSLIHVRQLTVFVLFPLHVCSRLSAHCVHIVSPLHVCVCALV